MRNRVLRAAMVIVSLLVGGALVVGIVVMVSRSHEKTQATAMADFKADLGTQQGYALAASTRAKPNPRIEKEGNGSVIEANVVVRGCELEFERRFGDRKPVATWAGRQVERFVLDEAVSARGAEIDPPSGAPTTPTILDMVQYLKANESRFKYCLKLTAQDRANG